MRLRGVYRSRGDSIRQIQQCDQQQAQRMSEMHTQNAQQGQMQSAPMMM